MAWAFQQVAATTFGSTGTTIEHTYAGAVAAGSLLVCAVTHGNDPTSITSVVDDVNGAWAEIASGSPVTGVQTRHWGIYYFANSAAGTPTITATYASSVFARQIYAGEWSGIDTSSPFDVGAGQGQNNPGTGTDAITSGTTASTAQANSLAIGWVLVAQDEASLTVGTSYTERYNASPASTNAVIVEDQNIVSSGTAVAATATTTGASDDSLTIVSVFKEPEAASIEVPSPSFLHSPVRVPARFVTY